MHKHILPLLLTCLLTAFLTTVHAQPRTRPTTPKLAPTPKPDLLVQRDGTQLEVLVIEITDKEIVYKRFNNPKGPIFRVQKTNFNYLKYGTNGEIEQFTKVAQPAPTPTQPVPTTVQPAPVPTTAPYKQNTPTPVSQARQTDIPQGVRFGFRGGIQSASFSFNPNYYSTSNFIGFQAGIMVDKPIGKSGRFRPQLLYSSKGTKLVNPTTNASLKFSVNYLEVPIDLLFKIPTSSGQLLLGGGLYSGYALSGKVGSENATIGNSQTDTFTPIDFGLRASAWYDLPSGLTLNVFYSFGLSNTNPTISVNEPTVKNRAFGLGIGYFLSR
ncbi:porin family protein [Spirosoma aerolatum]|uniref:porin family protein n=1 Tax=Spirosoma aerolatum TaxID=1211326 RepID=UPI0009ACEAD7|nr:porin family protein [Spirosoma aerolatum]